MRIHPRMRGDQPAVVARRPVSFAFTPHARGSTYHDSWSMSRKIIYPACAGINPGERQVHRKHQHLPRRRGDQPPQMVARFKENTFTPHARGSTYADPRRWFCSQIYPAGAGINPIRYASGSQSIDLPRMRGDQPASGTDRADMPAFTPRVRGSTQGDGDGGVLFCIYPACAGINHDALTAETAGMSKVAQKFHW